MIIFQFAHADPRQTFYSKRSEPAGLSVDRIW